MAIRPAFQFYPAEWRNNAKLRRCTVAARGAWMDVMCILHDSDEYGVLRWPLKDIAGATGASMKLLQELVEKGVLKGANRDVAAYIFTPRHAGKAGDPVTLLPATDGPCWYCSRFVRDEYIRQRRGESSRFTADNQPPKDEPKPPPKPPIGERQGDGASTAYSSSTSLNQEQEQKPLVRQAARYDEAFELSWAEYPKRGGGNSKAAAAKAWAARSRSGESVADMAAGVVRYAKFIRETGKEGTEFVKQAATFFGPDKHYLDDWIPPRIPVQTAAPSKTLSAIQRLEDMKNGLADTRDYDGLPEAPLLGFGPHTGHGFD